MFNTSKMSSRSFQTNVGPAFFERVAFMEDMFRGREVGGESIGYTLRCSAAEFVESVREALGTALVQCTSVEEWTVTSGTVVAQLQARHDGDPASAGAAWREAILFGLPDDVRRAAAALREKWGPLALPEVEWWLMTKDGPVARHVVLERPPVPAAAFYPWLPEEPEAFIDAYLASSASLLFLAGTHGTGKTSLIRHMITSRGMVGYLTYESAVLDSDAMFLDFMLSPRRCAMVIEDADGMLAARSSNGNELVKRFLNVSDGLVRCDNKKVIFTTNLEDFHSVDPALLRPGRCFASLRGRALTAEEATAAARVAQIKRSAPGSCTLAEMFNGVARQDIGTRIIGISPVPRSGHPGTPPAGAPSVQTPAMLRS